jgi:hypothetical protein
MRAKLYRLRRTEESEGIWSGMMKLRHPRMVQRLHLHGEDDPSAEVVLLVYADADDESPPEAEFGGDWELESEETFWSSDPPELEADLRERLADHQRYTARRKLAEALAQRLAPEIPKGFHEVSLAHYFEEKLEWWFKQGAVYDEPIDVTFVTATERVLDEDELS